MTTPTDHFDMTYEIDGRLLSTMLNAGLESLACNVRYLNELNIFPVSDSDTGTNMRNTFENGVATLKEDDSFGSVFSDFVKGMLIGSRGNSGLILSQYFLGISYSIESKKTVTVADLCAALCNAYRLAYDAVLTPVDGTMLTVMRDGINKALPYVTKSTSVNELFDVLTREMFLCTLETIKQMDSLRENNVVDSGALGFYLIFDGMKNALHHSSDYLDCKNSELLPRRISNLVKNITFFRFCTEFAIKLQNINGKDYYVRLLENRGDSIVVAKDDSILKVHIHTNEPQKIIDEFSRFGIMVAQKVDDLFLTQEFEKLRGRKHKGFSVIAFTSGEGNAVTLERLGVDVAFAVPFGHSPSEETLKMLTQEFLSGNLIVFADDKSIQEMFRRIKWFANLQNVYVVETKGLPSTFFMLSSLIFADEYKNIIKSLDVLKRQRVFCMNITSDRNFVRQIDDAAKEIARHQYGTVVAFGGKDCRPADAGFIADYFGQFGDIDFTYFEGRQENCDFVVGAV